MLGKEENRENRISIILFNVSLFYKILHARVTQVEIMGNVHLC